MGSGMEAADMCVNMFTHSLGWHTFNRNCELDFVHGGNSPDAGIS